MIIESPEQIDFRFYQEYLFNGEFHYLQEAKRKGFTFVYEFNKGSLPPK